MRWPLQVDNTKHIIPDVQAWSIKIHLSTGSSQASAYLPHNNDSCKKHSTSESISCVADLKKHWLAKVVYADKGGEQTKYRCEPCWMFRASIGKMHSYRGKLPSICSDSGILFRDTLPGFTVSWAYSVQQLWAVDEAIKTHIRVQISRANEVVANRDGSLMIEIYNNAKRGTVLA